MSYSRIFFTFSFSNDWAASSTSGFYICELRTHCVKTLSYYYVLTEYMIHAETDTCNLAQYTSPGWGYSHIQAIWICAAVKGMVFKQFSLGYGKEIREFWLRTRYHLPGN